MPQNTPPAPDYTALGAEAERQVWAALPEEVAAFALPAPPTH